jgi:hypothetical protein
MVRELAHSLHLAFGSALGVAGVRLYEQPAYIPLSQLPDGIELRRYLARAAAEVALPAADHAEEEAFRALFHYIAGQNRDAADGKRARRIAMTIPVEIGRAGGMLRMRFFLPKSFDVRSAPEPLDPLVHTVSVPSATHAVLRFSGASEPRRLKHYKARLLACLPHTAWQAAEAPVGLFYDAPFTLPFLRRNEAAVRVSLRRLYGA